MVRQTTKVIFFEVLGGISLLLMAAVAFMAIRLASGPVELGFLHERVEQAISQVRSDRPVEIERLTLQWEPSERRVAVMAYGVSLQDIDRVERGMAQQARIILDSGALLTGKVTVLGAELESGWLDVRSTGPNQWEVAGEPVPEIQARGLPTNPQEWLDLINRVLADVRAGLRIFNQSVAFDSLSFDKMDIRILGEEDRVIATIETASGGLEHSDQDWSLSLSGSGAGIGLPGEFAALITTSGQTADIQANLDLGIWRLSDLLSLAGVEALSGGEDLSIGTSFAARASEAEGLEEIEMVLAREDGSLALQTLPITLSEIDAWLSYRPGADILDIRRVSLAADQVSGVFSGSLSNILSDNALHRLELTGTDVQVNLTPYFPQAWTFETVDLRADTSDDYSIFEVERLNATYGDLNFSAAGQADFSIEYEPGEIPVAIDLAAEMVGETGKETVLSFWPETLGDGGRRFVRDRIEDIRVTGANAVLKLRPDSRAEGYLRDEDLAVSFGFQDGQVRFLSDMPPVRSAIGTGQVGGNSFSATVTEALYDDWVIDSGRVDFPAFNPRGEDFFVVAEGSGPVVSILRQLSQSRVKLQENTGFDPERVSGQATARFEFSRPTVGQVPFEDTNLKVTGVIEQAGLKDVVLEQSLTGGRINVDMTQERLVLSGFADLGAVPVQFTWRDSLGPDNRPADLSASGVLSPDVLNEFGLVGRAYLTGEVPVEVQGEVSAEGLGSAKFGFDLRGARLAIDEIGWSKPAGEPARAVIIYAGEDGLNESSVLLESETAIIDGDIRLQSDGRLESLQLRRLFIDGTADLSGEISRTRNGEANMVFTGAFLNLDPILRGAGEFEDGSTDGFSLPLRLEADVERLRLRRGLDLTDAEARVETALDRLLEASATGTTTTGETLSARYENRDNGPPEISLTAGNAGFLAEAFLGLEFIEGGALDLRGTLSRGDEPTRLLVSVTDARLVNAPFVTQILSLASLRGLSDTLSGDGVLFSDIVIPVSVGGGRYIIDGGRANGPALGLTANGWIGTDGEGIEMDGVLVPSFGVNSALGGVPIIGDLFVGRKGEGIFSITYSVRGTLEKAQVAVNPLSAVTPGILRRIFENPSDTSIPEALPVDPNLKPPSELPELPEDEVIAPAPGSGQGG